MPYCAIALLRIGTAKYPFKEPVAPRPPFSNPSAISWTHWSNIGLITNHMSSLPATWQKFCCQRAARWLFFQPHFLKMTSFQGFGKIGLHGLKVTFFRIWSIIAYNFTCLIHKSLKSSIMYHYRIYSFQRLTISKDLEIAKFFFNKIDN